MSNKGPRLCRLCGVNSSSPGNRGAWLKVCRQCRLDHERVHGKECPDCKTVKPLDGFHPSTRERDGRTVRCIECQSVRDAAPAYKKRRAADMARRRLDPVLCEKIKAYEKTPKARRTKRAYAVRRDFGLDDWDLAHMYEAQDRKCAGCLTPLVFDKATVIDHCHTTGAVRGLLCCLCNWALGSVKDNPETLRRLAKYVGAPRDATFLGTVRASTRYLTGKK